MKCDRRSCCKIGYAGYAMTPEVSAGSRHLRDRANEHAGAGRYAAVLLVSGESHGAGKR